MTEMAKKCNDEAKEGYELEEEIKFMLIQKDEDAKKCDDGNSMPH
jgi:hypothetical protein